MRRCIAIASFAMLSYRDRLQPWCIIQCLPNAQTLIIARFRRRNDAEAQLQVLKRLTPTASYQVIFDNIPPHPSR